MKILQKMNAFGERALPVTLAAGFFDGVHRGHRSILEHAIKSAHEHGGQAWVLTFDTHPLKVLSPAVAPLMITSTQHKLNLIEQSGIDGCIVLPFSHEIAAIAPHDFAKWLLSYVPVLKEVGTGSNWHFGADGAGTPDLLRELGRESGLKVTALPPVMDGDEPISSTRIRKAIMHGELEHAAAMLGRPPSVLGTIVHGRAIGRQLGFPSANIDPHNEALPPLGVYAVQAVVRGELFDGVLNFGRRPTFDKDLAAPPILELHLLDFDGTLYDEDVEAGFIARIREEWYFSTVDELVEQIKKDITQAREMLAAYKAGEMV
jgi:riboflavin kinase/FMN adenylyltransferase